MTIVVIYSQTLGFLWLRLSPYIYSRAAKESALVFICSLPSVNPPVTMDAIKKKMQAMKVEKDNAMDRCDACEEASRMAKVRAEKAEEEVS